MKRRVLIILAIGLFALLLGVPVAVTRATSPTLQRSVSVSSTGVDRASSPGPSGTWSPAGSLNTPRAYHTATVLANGKVLVVGGYDHNGIDTSSAELYDPATGSWSPTSSLTTGRYLHTATLLPTGKVLVAGGTTAYVDLASAELYDPTTGSWSPTGTMSIGRLYFTATLLVTGKVLVVGGSHIINNNGHILASAELYDPNGSGWLSTGGFTTARANCTATVLASGKVLVAGGLGKHGSLASAELYI